MTERSATEADVRDWMAGYIAAWEGNDPDRIRALFAPDAEYRTEPWTDPWQGHEEIVAGWLERSDQAGDFTFTWDVAGIDGDRAFVQGRTVYRDGRTYRNLWVIDLAPDGRARGYTEWWMDESSPS